MTALPLMRTSSLMVKVTEAHCAQEHSTVKELCDELIIYLAEDLYLINEALSPELQGQAVF